MTKLLKKQLEFNRIVEQARQMLANDEAEGILHYVLQDKGKLGAVAGFCSNAPESSFGVYGMSVHAAILHGSGAEHFLGGFTKCQTDEHQIKMH